MKVREATAEDAEAVARIHVDSWRASYAGIVPDSILRALSYEQRRRDWEKRVQVRETIVLVAENADGEVVGAGACGPSRFPVDGYTGEIYALYVEPGERGAGVGSELFAALRADLRERGMERVALWVYAEHSAGCAFYEKLGGRRVGERITEMAGEQIGEIAFGFA